MLQQLFVYFLIKIHPFELWFTSMSTQCTLAKCVFVTVSHSLNLLSSRQSAKKPASSFKFRCLTKKTKLKCHSYTMPTFNVDITNCWHCAHVNQTNWNEKKRKIKQQIRKQMSNNTNQRIKSDHQKKSTEELPIRQLYFW